jgi:hypothetical protein
MPAVDDDLKYGSALILAVIGILILAAVVIWLACLKWTATDITAICSVFTTLLGTLIGAFLGVQVGSAGKEKAENVARKALAALPPETAAKILE